jgi:hypothetical protein
VITVMQMCKKATGVTCTSKHIVGKMWKQWHVKDGKERGKENSDNKDEASLAKAIGRRKGIKTQRRKRLTHIITVRRKGTLKSIAGRKIH